jgi:hypothetical protein
LGLLDHIPRIGATFVLAQHLSLSAQSCRSPVVGHSALQPVRPDFRCDREILAQVNSQFADFVSVHCFPFKGRFQFIHRSQQPLGSAIDLG